MRHITKLLIVSGLFVLTGCASLTKPSQETFAKLPVVKFGETALAGKKFIIHYPAGTPLPVVASVKGSLFVQPVQETIQVSLRNDIYLFEKWVSLDGKTWQPRSDVVTGSFEMTIPGLENGKNPGKLSAEFNEK